MKKLLLTLAGVCALLGVVNAQDDVKVHSKIDPETIKEKMEWFGDAKLGIFIHTGIYAVKGVSESWSFHNGQISHEDYMKQLSGFTLSKYDPAYWADLIKETGARYAVITTKHHDGVAMYDTKMNNLSIVKKSPAKRDMIQPFVEELRKRDIKFGAYFSILDWSDSNYPEFLKDKAPRYVLQDNWAKWQAYRTFYQGQIQELSSKFNPDLFWFDGDWEHTPEQWEAEKVRAQILKHNPNAIINGRLMGQGDYDTPEQNFPITRPKERWWELCMTMNNSWGYFPTDTAYKTPFEVITIFADAISNGGNMLLDIGPKADGSIPEEQIHIMKELGKWTKKHSEAIFDTQAGLPQGHFYGPSTRSKDGKTLYLFLSGNPTTQVVIKGLKNKVESVSVMGSNEELRAKVVGKISWSHVPGLVYIDLPKNPSFQDQYLTVLKVKLADEVNLYRGAGGFFAENGTTIN